MTEETFPTIGLTQIHPFQQKQALEAWAAGSTAWIVTSGHGQELIVDDRPICGDASVLS